MVENEKEIFQQAYEKALKMYQEKPTHENSKNLQAAKKILEEVLNNKEDEGPIFTNPKEVWKYLFKKGYKISDKSPSKVYYDEENGHLKKQKGNKHYTLKDIQKYINKVQLEMADGSDKETGCQEKTADWKLREQQADTKRKELKLAVEEGQYIPISDVEKELAHRGALLKTGIDNFFTTQGRTIIDICGGSQEKESAFVNYCLDSMEDHFDQYSKDMEFDAPYVNSNNEESEG